MSSAERASAMIRNPPAEKRLTMAAPVPGPTPVTIAIGFSVIDAPFELLCGRSHMNSLGLRLICGRLLRGHQGQTNRDVLVVGRARDRIAIAALGEQIDA